MNAHPTKLSAWMAASGTNDEALSKAIKCSRPMVTRLRRGQASPSLALAHRIREATGGAVTADDFLPPLAAAPAPLAEAG